MPVVALESAVISHGLPSPVGIETAAALEAEVRRGGAVPATVAVVDGRIVVGALGPTLRRLVAGDAMKIAERDLAVAVATGATGGTTVSATIAAAAACGIAVMSTGGIGGVHLGAERTWDVSADLPALTRHSVLVVCAGTKAICDIPRTLEYLDTAGVPVLAYGTDAFPYFYARDSGTFAPHRVDTPAAAAAVLAARRSLVQPGGVLVAQPIPERDALPAPTVDAAVAEALRRTQDVRGAALTPALLSALAEITTGRTLSANLALLRANAMLAAAIAQALHRKGFVPDGT
jgi:pseudouridine-5'-phosphate glycosidase